MQCYLESKELCHHELKFISESAKVEHSVVSKLATALKNKSMTDVKIVVGEQEFECHRLILSVSSNVFQTMLMNAKWTESKESRVVLVESEECAEVFKYFLEFIYMGKIHFTITNVLPLLMLADKYNVQDLVQSCSKFMEKNLSLAIKAGVLAPWIKYSESSSQHRLAKIFTEFAKWNFFLIIKAGQFNNFDSSLIISLLRENDLIVENEKSLFGFIEKWLNKHRKECSAEEDFGKLVKEILLHIRFPMMSTNEISDIVLSPLAKEDKEFFFDRVAMGLAFHRGNKSMLRKAVEENSEMLFKPRLYISDQYSFMKKYSYRDISYMTVISENFITSGVLEGVHKVFDWMLEVYPRGVTHEKCILIRKGKPGLVVPGGNLSHTTRVTLLCRNAPFSPKYVSMKIGILVYENVCHEMYVTKKHDITYRFSSNDNRLVVGHHSEFGTLLENQNNFYIKLGDFILRIIAIPIYDLKSDD